MISVKRVNIAKLKEEELIPKDSEETFDDLGGGEEGEEQNE